MFIIVYSFYSCFYRREKLGISLGEQIVIDDFSHRNLNRQNKIFELTTELETCQDELLSIKLEVNLNFILFFLYFFIVKILKFP